MSPTQGSSWTHHAADVFVAAELRSNATPTWMYPWMRICPAEYQDIFERISHASLSETFLALLLPYLFVMGKKLVTSPSFPVGVRSLYCVIIAQRQVMQNY